MVLFRHTKLTLNHSVTLKPLDYKNNGSYMTVIKRPIETPQTRINTGFLRPLNLFPLAIEICVPDTSGDSVFQVLQIIRIHSCGTMSLMKISYHKQYHGDTAAY